MPKEWNRRCRLSPLTPHKHPPPIRPSPRRRSFSQFPFPLHRAKITRQPQRWISVQSCSIAGPDDNKKHGDATKTERGRMQSVSLRIYLLIDKQTNGHAFRTGTARLATATGQKMVRKMRHPVRLGTSTIAPFAKMERDELRIDPNRILHHARWRRPLLFLPTRIVLTWRFGSKLYHLLQTLVRKSRRPVEHPQTERGALLSKTWQIGKGLNLSIGSSKRDKSESSSLLQK